MTGFSCQIFQIADLCARRYICRSCSLTELKRTDVGSNCPTVFRRQLLGVIGHGPIAVSHYIEVMRDGLGAANRVIQVCCGLIAALHDFAEAVSDPRVTGGAIDIEA